MTTNQHYDVVVVGTGNAALCAALSARETVERVLILEKAPQDARGGNSYFTAGGFRFVHQGLRDLQSDVLVDLSPGEADLIDLSSYTRESFYNDLMAVTDDRSDENLASILIDKSRETVVWMRRYGVRWLPMFQRPSYKMASKTERHSFSGGLNVEASGGGAGLVQSLLDAALKAKIEIRYDTAARELLQNDHGAVNGVKVQGPQGIGRIYASAIVLACGGFEANPEWRSRYLGPGWELCRVRGTRYNTGDGISMALDIGAEAYGNWSSCHAVGWDISAPPFGDRVVLDSFQKHSYPLGIMVNLDGKRFVDEGATYRNLTYARYGREIMKQPRQSAVQIFDAKTVELLRDEYRIRQVTKVQANSIAELAAKLEIDPHELTKTINAFNSACQSGCFDPSVLDGKSTVGLTPPKSNWANPIDTAPYFGFVTTCGITFTFGGLHINERGEVQDTSDRSIPGLYAAGELVGGLFYNNYPGGSGLMAGAVFGRISGHEAGTFSRSRSPVLAE